MAAESHIGKDRARSELQRVGLRPNDKRLNLLIANIPDDESILEGIEGSAECRAYGGTALVVLTNRRIVIVCEPNWLSALTSAPFVEQLLWQDIAQVSVQANGHFALFREGTSSPVAVTFYLSAKYSEAFVQFGARIRSRADAARNTRESSPSHLNVNELERLAELHRAGDLTAEEYQAAKARLLGLHYP